MINEIDLGDEVKVKVKFKGKEYTLREPTTGELESIHEGGKVNITDFLVKLGMPTDIMKDMGASKALALLEGITAIVTKKK